MIILHCIKKSLYENMQDEVLVGKPLLEKGPFIHCSSIEFFWRVALNFKNVTEKLILLCIDTDKQDVPVVWEDLENCGRTYPHIYGLIRQEAIVNVLPYYKDAEGTWIKNKELEHVKNA